MNKQLKDRTYQSDWELMPLSKFARDGSTDFVDGPFGSDLKVSDYTKTGVRVLQLQNLGDGQFISKNKIYTSQRKALLLNRCATYPGDIIIAKMAEPLARAALVPNDEDKYLIVADLIKLRVSLDVDSYYLLNFINFSDFRKEAERLSTGTTRIRISLSTLKKISLPKPPFPVQRKLGLIFKTIDRAIASTEALIEKYQHIKAGLMHDLFTRGIGADGKLRPPREQAPELYRESAIGWIPKEWNLKFCRDVYSVDSGITLGVHRRPKNSPRPYLRVANVFKEKIILNDVAYLEASAEENIRYSLNTHDLLLVEGHANIQQIGRCGLVEDNAEGMLFQNHLFRLRAIKVHPYFGMYFLNSHIARKYWQKSCSTSSGLNTINRTMLGKMLFAIPCDSEQLNIEKKIRSISDLLDREDRYLENLSNKKRGLMHDLLTGKVPVTPYPTAIASN